MNTALTMTAGGFAPGEPVVISVDGKRRPQRLIADANGEVRLTITLTPDLRPGTVTVRASGASATVTRQLRITAPIASLPETGAPSTIPVVAALVMMLSGAVILRRRRIFPLRP
jgi:LPXTG-motif cell wall-anchored protein